MTLFAERSLLLCFLLSIPIVLIHLYPAKDFDEPPLSPISISRSASPTHTGNNASDSGKGSSSRIVIAPLPALTIYRAHMMLMTILAILAVDFPVFPRSLAKCETFGVSLVRCYLLWMKIYEITRGYRWTLVLDLSSSHKGLYPQYLFSRIHRISSLRRYQSLLIYLEKFCLYSFLVWFV